MLKPEDILAQWMSAVNEGKVDVLLALYNEKAILFPTFSNRILNTPEKIQAYFQQLSTREELSIALHEKTLAIQPLDDKLYSLSGIYCWRFSVDEEMLSFEARFTYVVNLDLKNPIIHHHSSQIPRAL